MKQGPYGYVRHPIYTDLILLFVGTTINAGTAGAIVAIIPLVLSCLIKSRQEERVLLGEFGGQYKEYMRQVPALIPRIRRSRAALR